MTGEQGIVLVVDDEENVRNLLQRMLGEAGYSVVTAANGQETLDKVSQLNIGVVFLDIRMPGMSGMEVLQQLTADRPDICVIMATAVGDAQTSVEAVKLGAYDYITKPFNLDDVVPRVRRAIQKRDLLLDNERYRRNLEGRVGEQAERLQQQFVELVATLAREHKLLYQLSIHQPGGIKVALSKLPPELQEPLSSVEEFSEALLRILRRGTLRPGHRASADVGKGSKR